MSVVCDGTFFPYQITPSSWSIATYSKNSYFFHQNGDAFVCGATSNGVPQKIELPNKSLISSIVPGKNHTFYLDKDGCCFVNGEDKYGQFGVGDDIESVIQPQLIPVTYPFKQGLKTIKVGPYNTFFQDKENNWYACGDNSTGQLGLTGPTYFSTPTLLQLSNNQPIAHIVCADTHTFFQDVQGVWFGSGRNVEGLLGIKTNYPNAFIPLLITLKNHNSPKNIVVGVDTTFMQDKEGNWYGCGRNDFGQLGLFKQQVGFEFIREPTLITLPNGKAIEQIVPSRHRTFFADSDNKWYSCGLNGENQLGIGIPKKPDHFYDSPTPMDIHGLKPIFKFVAGEGHAFYLDSLGDWYGFGLNSSGQLAFSKSRQRVITPDIIDFAQFELSKPKFLCKVLEQSETTTVRNFFSS